MNRPTNTSRAARAAAAIVTYEDGDSMSPSEALSDLLCDLQHYCDASGLDFAACRHRANSNYVAEYKAEESVSE